MSCGHQAPGCLPSTLSIHGPLANHRPSVQILKLHGYCSSQISFQRPLQPRLHLRVTTVSTASSEPGIHPPGPTVSTISTSSTTSASIHSWNVATHDIVSVRQRWSSTFFPSSAPWSNWWTSCQQWMFRAVQLLQYRLMLLFRLPTWGKLVALVAVGLPIVAVGAALLVRVAGLAWGEAAQVAFFVLQSVPGTDVVGFCPPHGRVVLVAVHLLSLYTFATLVGLLTEDVRSTVEDIRCGNFPIPSCGHTVLLDCSGDATRLVGLLRKVLEAREVHGGSVYDGDIAVLSTHPKKELDKMIADVLRNHAGRVVTRYGNPGKVTDLERVAAAHAATLLLLAPDRPMGHITPALQQQLCLTALRCLHSLTHGSAGPPAPSVFSTAGPLPQGRVGALSWWSTLTSGKAPQRPQRQRVIVESSCVAVPPTPYSPPLPSTTVNHNAEEDPLQVTYVSSASSTYRAAVQCAVQPGLAAVFDAVFIRADDASLRLVDLPVGLSGQTFAEVRRRYLRAVLCGVLPGSERSSSNSREMDDSCINMDGGGGGGSLTLSPPDDMLLLAGDRLLLLAAGRDDCAPWIGEMQVPPLPYLSSRNTSARPRRTRLVLLALDSTFPPPLLLALEEFAAEGGRVCLLSPKPCSGVPLGPTLRRRLMIKNLIGNPMDLEVLRAAEVAAADAVILTGTNHLPADESDAVAVGMALQLQRLVASYGSATDAVTTVAGFGTWQDYGGSGGSNRDGAGLSGGSVSTLSSLDFCELPSLAPAPASEAVSEPSFEVQESALWSPPTQPPPPPLPPLPPLSSLPLQRPLTFVCSLRDPQNRLVLQQIGMESCRTEIRTAEAFSHGGGSGSDGGHSAPRGLHMELLEPQALISGMLAQVGAEPLLVGALEDLLDEQGYEIYIKRCDRYGMAPSNHMSWGQASEVVRQAGEVALGYIHHGQLHLAPPVNQRLELVAGDKLVVLSENFE